MLERLLVDFDGSGCHPDDAFHSAMKALKGDDKRLNVRYLPEYGCAWIAASGIGIGCTNPLTYQLQLLALLKWMSGVSKCTATCKPKGRLQRKTLTRSSFGWEKCS